MIRPDLKTTQELFWRLTQTPEGVEGFIAAHRETPSFPFREMKDFLVENERGEALERMEVYVQSYFLRIYDSLREDFPATEFLLGEDDFHGLIVDYLLAHPSRFRDLAEVGIFLPEFLETHPLGSAENRRYLSDLARLEWLQIEVEREADATPLKPDDLKKIPPEAWGELSFRLIPALRIAKLDYPVLNLWKSCMKKKPPTPFPSSVSPQTLLVWRKNFQVFSSEISEEESCLLTLLKKNVSFARLCEALAEKEEAQTTAKALQYLNTWLEREILV